jgi:hypothetical protein
LSSLEGAAITSIRITGAQHEFASLTGIVEDVTDIVLNLKKIKFKAVDHEPPTVQPRIKAPRSSSSFTEAIIANLLRKAKSVPPVTQCIAGIYHITCFNAWNSVVKKIKLTVVTGTGEWFLFSES